jgi:hypothetical protein
VLKFVTRSVPKGSKLPRRHGEDRIMISRLLISSIITLDTDSSACDTIDMMLFGSGKILDSHRAISRSARGETSLDGNRGSRDGYAI